MRKAVWLISFIACSCASRKPLDVQIGAIVDESRVEWQSRTVSQTPGFSTLPDCEAEKCVVIRIDDFAKLLEQCRIRP